MAISKEDYKRVQHFDCPGHAHELTFSCYQKFPLLASQTAGMLLARAIDAAVSGHSFRLVGFVFMPDHVHLVVYPLTDAYSISALLKAIKRPHSFRVKQDMVARCDPWLAKLQVRERPGTHVFRFWQEGPGHDRNLLSTPTRIPSGEGCVWRRAIGNGRVGDTIAAKGRKTRICQRFMDSLRKIS